MASSHGEEEAAATCHNPYRVRSISLPSRSHPLALRFQEELAVLKSWAAEAPIPHPAGTTASTSHTHLVTGLQAVSRVYDAVQNLLRMPGVRRAVAAEHARRGGRSSSVASELEESVRLLDACASARDSLALVKDAARGFQCAIRIRAKAPKSAGADPAAALRGHARDYEVRRREAAREMAKCARELKAASVVDEQLQVQGAEAPAASAGGGDQEELSLIIGALRDARTAAAVVLRGVLSGYAPKSAVCRPATGWGLVSKALLLKTKAKAAPAPEAVEASLPAMIHKAKTKWIGEADLLQAQRHLEALEAGAAGVETALECVFRRLVRNQADLLNIVNNV